VVFSPPKNCHVAANAADLNRGDVSGVDLIGGSGPAAGRWDACSTGRNEADFHDAAQFVTVAIHSAFTSRIELKQFPEHILSGRARIADWVLETVWGCKRRSVWDGAV
jgi:hypothetical protein